MEGSFDSRAEVLRIANLTGIDPEDIGFLSRLSADSLHELREQLIGIYFEPNPALNRLARLANVLPGAVIAKLTVEAIGPVLSARIVGEVDTTAAINVLKRVPTGFICDTVVQTDPRRIVPLFIESPRDIAKAIADELIRRKEYVAIGQLIGFVEDDVIEHALHKASDVDILLSSFMVEDKVRLGEGVAMLDDERIASIIRTAGDKQMWLEALDLTSHLEEPEFRRITSEAMKLDGKRMGEMFAFMYKERLWHIAIPAVCLAEDPSKAIDLVLGCDPAARKAILDELATGHYADELEELLGKVDNPELQEFLEPVSAG